jgi:uncharacterized protein YecT (DUF1311 family)
MLASMACGLVIGLSAGPAAATAPEWMEAHQKQLAAEKRLNANYQALLAKLDATGKQRLIAAEQAWLAFRDAEIAFNRDRMRGGSGATTLGEQTNAKLTAARAENFSVLAGWADNSDEMDPDHATPGLIKQSLATQAEATATWSKTLDQHYRLVAGAIDPQARALLAQAESRWLAYRDAEARLWAELVPKFPYASTLRETGMTNMTRERAEQLGALLALWRSRR